MMRVVPAFDAHKGCWYVVEPRGIDHEARTLRELKAKLEQEHGALRIKDYYPQGYSYKRAQEAMR
jgi:hypothetical protein